MHSAENNLEQVASLLCAQAQANSASYPYAIGLFRFVSSVLVNSVNFVAVKVTEVSHALIIRYLTCFQGPKGIRGYPGFPVSYLFVHLYMITSNSDSAAVRLSCNWSSMEYSSLSFIIFVTVCRSVFLSFSAITTNSLELFVFIKCFPFPTSTFTMCHFWRFRLHVFTLSTFSPLESISGHATDLRY